MKIFRLILITLLFINFSPFLSFQSANARHFLSEKDVSESTQIPGVEGAFAVITTDDKGGFFVAYQSLWGPDNNQTFCSHIYFTYSHDYGKTWCTSFRISDDQSTTVSLQLKKY